MLSNIGIEVEFTGITRDELCGALSKLWNTEIIFIEGHKRDGRKIKDTNGQEWLVVRDRSISPEIFREGKTISLDKDAGEEYMIELVSPVLNQYSLPRLFEALNIASELGGRVNETCGLHIHIDLPDINLIKKIIINFFLAQPEIFKTFDVKSWREEKYCKKYSEDFINKMSLAQSVSELQEITYNELAPGEKIESIKNSSRYYAINLDAIDKHSTIEFRFFNSSLSPFVINGYLDWLKEFLFTVKNTI